MRFRFARRQISGNPHRTWQPGCLRIFQPRQAGSPRNEPSSFDSGLTRPDAPRFRRSPRQGSRSKSKRRRDVCTWMLAGAQHCCALFEGPIFLVYPEPRGATGLPAVADHSSLFFQSALFLECGVPPPLSPAGRSFSSDIQPRHHKSVITFRALLQNFKQGCSRQVARSSAQTLWRGRVLRLRLRAPSQV
jgi:hypothetical protein